MRRTDQPMASMRWWMCSRSGWAICRSVARIDRPSAGRASAAPHQRQRAVGDRQREDQQRHAGGQRGRALLPTGDRGRRQQKSGEQAAAVAEEDRRRREVEDQEAERGADERGEQHRFRRMAADDQDRAAGRAGERGDAGGEPVDAVDQVEGVGHADQPRRGHRPGDPAERPRPAQQRDALDQQARRHHDRRRGELDQQLRRRSQPAHVVDQADQEDQCRRR